MKYFIDRDLETYTKSFSDESAKNLKRGFKSAITIIRSIFDKEAFHRYQMGGERNSNGGWISKNFNSALYDILMFSFSKASRNLVQNHLDSIREALIDLMTNNDRFIRSIDKSTSSSETVTMRFKIWEETLGQIMESTKQPRCFSYKLKKEFYDADPTCALCGQRIRDIDDAALDHIQQYWLGGKTLPENARLTHRYCNWARSRNSEISYVPRNTARKIYKKITLRGDSYVCKTSWQILFHTAEWLIKNDILRNNDCPIRISRGNRYLINSTPLHIDGHEFTAPKLLSNGLYIEVHAGTPELINQTCKMLEYFRIAKETLKIEEIDEEETLNI
jgi:hypothetical protein